MFNNRPALKKDMPIQMAENQKKFADLEKDFFIVRDAVQRELLSNNNNDIMMNAVLGRSVLIGSSPSADGEAARHAPRPRN